MLIPNKFNGYQADGRRLLPVGGGVGEAALIGAAMGGGSAALTGGDPLKGALIGGLTGGIGGGMSSGITALNPAATAGTAGAAGAGTAGAAGAGTAAGTAGTTLAGSALGASPTAAQVGTQLGVQGVTTGAGSQAAMLADQMAGFGSQGLASLQSAAQGAIPAGTLPSTAATAIGTPVAQTAIPQAGIPTTGGTFTEGMQRFAQDPLASIGRHRFLAGASALTGAVGSREDEETPSTEYKGPLSRFRYDPDLYRPQFAEGGITNLPVERMSERNDLMTMMANGGQMYAAGGGISDLGSYSDGGRMLKGPGDGMSDSIPASIANKRPARLATDEFVVPADVVSHLGNGSSDAGAKQLYAMMDRVRKARTGTRRQGRQINPRRVMPA